MKAVIDADLCTGCGLCVDVCPDVFEMKDDKAVVLGDDVADAAEDACREASDNCPVEAIACND